MSSPTEITKEQKAWSRVYYSGLYVSMIAGLSMFFPPFVLKRDVTGIEVGIIFVVGMAAFVMSMVSIRKIRIIHDRIENSNG